MEKGTYIVFEGPEACGKSTQLEKTYLSLTESGIPCIKTLEPGGTELGEKLRKILLHAEGYKITSLAELALYSADRAQLTEEIIIPSLNKGINVLSDRNYDSTLTYQGFGRGLDIQMIKTLNKIFTQELEPDVSFIFYGNIEVFLKRASRRRELDRFESEDIEFHKRIMEGYLTLAEQSPEKYILINGEKHEEEIQKEVIQHLKEKLSI